MTDKEIKLGRKKYQELLLQKQILSNYKMEILQLQKDSKVKRYIELTNYCNRINELSDEYNIFYPFAVISNSTTSSNKLYAYMGSYVYNENTKTKTFFGDIGGNYIQYKDIENQDVLMIKSSESEEFENKNKVMYLNLNPINDRSNRIEEYNMAFYKARMKFFELLINHSQEESVNKMLENNQKVKIKK